ncbi:MAG: TadE/TadG family type IV pilus assembly protein [Acidimicrobiia bacterium]
MGDRERQRGATLVEAALVLPIIILLTVSLLELGLAFRAFLTLSFTAREAARVGSLAGNDLEADCDIIQSIVAAFGPGDLSDVNIQIFKANEGSGEPVVRKVNTWALQPSGDPTTCGPIDWSITETWPSVDRKVTVGPTSSLDILGVTIATDHRWVTGFPPWRGTMNISRTALQRLEPEAFE